MIDCICFRLQNYKKLGKALGFSGLVMRNNGVNTDTMYFKAMYNTQESRWILYYPAGF